MAVTRDRCDGYAISVTRITAAWNQAPAIPTNMRDATNMFAFGAPTCRPTPRASQM